MKSFGKALQVGLTVCCGIPVAVLAQGDSDADGTRSVALEEVIVTAEKRTASIQDVAMTVNAVSGETLEKQAIFDFKDLQTLTPGLQLENNDPRAPVAILRGIAYDPDSAAGSAVDMYFNEVPIAPLVAFQSMFDTGQIEVLRGPQGTLRGRTSPGGAITIAARKPSLDTWEASIAGNFSTNDLVNVQLAGGGPLIEDRLGIRLAVLSDDNGANGIRNITRESDQQAKTRAGRIVVNARPFDALEVTLTHQDLDAELDIYDAVESAPGSTREPRIDAYDRKAVSKREGLLETQFKITTLEIDWELFGGHTLSLLTGHQSNMQTTRRDLDSGNAWPAADFPQYVQLDISQPELSQEVRLSSPQHQAWTYMIGAYYDEAEGDVTVIQRSNATLFDDPEMAPLFGYDQFIYLPIEDEQRAIFARTRLEFGARFSVELGVRKTKTKTFTQAFFTPKNHPANLEQIDALRNIPLIPEDLETRESDPTTGSFSASYQVSDDFLAYVTLARSYRGGGVNLGAPTGIDAEYLLFDEEFSDSTELGIKSDWFDRRLRFNAALFHQVFDGYIARSQYVPVDTDRNGQQDATAAFTYNADAATTGIETEVAVAWSERLQLSLASSYAKAVFDDAATPCDKRDANGNPEFTDENGNAGQQVALCANSGSVGPAPRFSTTLTAEYTWPLSAFDLFLRSLYKYDGDRELNNGEKLSGYGVVNLFVGAHNVAETWEVSVWAKNLLDEEALTNRGSAELGVNSDGTPFGTPGNSVRFDSGYIGVNSIREREIGVSFRYSL